MIEGWLPLHNKKRAAIRRPDMQSARKGGALAVRRPL
jgi:hypothetical protein